MFVLGLVVFDALYFFVFFGFSVGVLCFFLSFTICCFIPLCPFTKRGWFINIAPIYETRRFKKGPLAEMWVAHLGGDESI